MDRWYTAGESLRTPTIPGKFESTAIVIDLVSKNVFQWLHRTVWLFSIISRSSPQNHSSQSNDINTCLCCVSLVLVIATVLLFLFMWFIHQYSASWTLELMDEIMWYYATIKNEAHMQISNIQYVVEIWRWYYYQHKAPRCPNKRNGVTVLKALLDKLPKNEAVYF